MNNASCSMSVVSPFLSRYSFAVSHRSMGWGRKQIMDLRSSESHNDDDGFGHCKPIKKYMVRNAPNAATISMIVPFCSRHPSTGWTARSSRTASSSTRTRSTWGTGPAASDRLARSREVHLASRILTYLDIYSARDFTPLLPAASNITYSYITE